MSANAALQRRLSRIRWGAAIVAFIWIVADFLLLPESAGAKRQANLAWEAVFPKARETFHPWRIEATVHRDSAGISLDFELERYREPSRIGDAWVRPRRFTYGWWAPTRESYDPTLQIFTDIDLSLEEQKQIRKQFVEYLHQNDLTEFATWVDEGRGRVERPLPWGIARNAAAVLAVTFIIVPITMRVRQRWMLGCARRRSAAGYCASCGYDLHSIPSDLCPECGSHKKRSRLE